jgi:hypothetical protein
VFLSLPLLVEMTRLKSSSNGSTGEVQNVHTEL